MFNAHEWQKTRPKPQYFATSVRMSQDLADRLEKYSYDHRISVSEIIRRSCVEYLQRVEA